MFEENERLIPYCAGLLINEKKSIYYMDDKEENFISHSIIFSLVKDSEDENNSFFVYDLNLDGVILIEWLTQNKLNFKLRAQRGEIYWIKLIQIHKIIIFRCFRKILPVSWKFINDIEGLNKFEICSENEERKNIFINKEKNINLCLNKIQILKRCISNLISMVTKLDTSVLDKCFSAPSISHYIFFKHYNIKKIDQRIKNSLDDYCRAAYKGGRCEVFGNLKENEITKYFDFPGMYGLSMKEKFHNGKWEFTTKSPLSSVGFHTITFKSNMNIPVLPSYSFSNKLLFANGVFTDTVWFEELLYFISNGGEILEHHHSLIFEKFEEVFTDFVDHFNEVREKGGYYKIFGKLMINSLYGSLSLKKENIYNYITFSETEFLYLFENLNVEKFYKINDVFVLLIINDYKFKNLYKNDVFSKDFNRNVSYAAAITAKARIKLHKLFCEIERDGGRVLYCDTDSVFAAYDKDRLEKNIGSLKWISIYKDSVFASPKSYALQTLNDEEIIKIKGISAQKISFDVFKKEFYENSELNFENQILKSKKNLTLEKKTISKNINFNNYSKRKFSKDKKTTTPIFTDLQ